MTGVAICKPISFVPKLLCSILQTIINCNVSARFLQDDGELSVIRIVDPGRWIGVIIWDAQGMLGITGGEIYSILGHSCCCCCLGENGINNSCDELGIFEITGCDLSFLGHGGICCDGKGINNCCAERGKLGMIGGELGLLGHVCVCWGEIEMNNCWFEIGELGGELGFLQHGSVFCGG